MNQIALYAPAVGGALAIFGIVRVLMRSGVEFGRGMGLQTRQSDSADRQAIWRALISPSGRMDLGAIALGLAILAIFIVSIS